MPREPAVIYVLECTRDIEVVSPRGQFEAVVNPFGRVLPMSASGKSAHWPVNSVTGLHIEGFLPLVRVELCGKCFGNPRTYGHDRQSLLD